MNEARGPGYRAFILLHLLLLIYSFSNVFSKLAAGEAFLSMRFCLFYGASLGLLAVYALGWQQVIRRMPLTTAFAHKAATVATKRNVNIIPQKA